MSGTIPVQINSVATALPDYKFAQAEASSIAASIFGKSYSEFGRLANVFETSGIKTRYAAKPLDWYTRPLSWSERQNAYLEVATDLFIKAARQAISDAHIDPKTIATVVIVSSTGIATPSLDARAISALGLSDHVQRVPVFGLGCAGGVSGLKIASDLARAHLGKPILFVTVELCTISFRSDAATKSNIVATALFGDGAAACILTAHTTAPSHSLSITNTSETIFPDTLDLMGWNVDDIGLDVIFARSIPEFAQHNVAHCVRNILTISGLKQDNIGRFICHPGGAKVVQAIEDSLSLADGTLADERKILRDYGNMSAPTVLFVLKEAMTSELPHYSLMLAMGPGFTISSALLERQI